MLVEFGSLSPVVAFPHWYAPVVAVRTVQAHVLPSLRGIEKICNLINNLQPWKVIPDFCNETATVILQGFYSTGVPASVLVIILAGCT